jgi:toxin ParE1/3/4
MPTIQRTRQSEADVVEIILRVRQENPAAADRMLDAIDAALRMLAHHPGLGVSRQELAPALRSLPLSRYPSYLIFYRPITDGIEVIRVLHGARDLPPLFGDG